MTLRGLKVVRRSIGIQPNKGRTITCMLGWTVRRERMIYSGWRSREIEVGRTYSRLE